MPVVEDLIVNRLVLEGVPGFGSGFSQAERFLTSFSGKLSEGDRLMMRFGVTAGAATGIISFLARATRAAAEDQANYVRAAGNFKGAFPADEMADLTEKTRRLTGVSDDTTTGVLGLLGTFQLTKQQATSLLLPLLNAAEAYKAYGLSAEQAAMQVGKAVQGGNALGLHRVGIFVDNAKAFESSKPEERVRMLAKALDAQGGQAAIRFRQTMLGAQQAVASGFQEIKESIGDGITNPVTGAINAVALLEDQFLDLDKAGKGALGRGVGNVLADMVPILGVMAIKSGQAALQTLRLNAENVQLTNSSLRAAAAMGEEATMASRLATTATAAAGATRAAGAANLGTAEMTQLAAGRGPAGAAGGGGRRLGMMQGMGVALLADMALQFAPDQGAGGTLKHIMEGAITGGVTGSLFGPWGAGIGAVMGGGLGAFQDHQAQEAQKRQSDPNSKLDKTNELLQKILDQGKGGLPFDQNRFAGSIQTRILYDH